MTASERIDDGADIRGPETGTGRTESTSPGRTPNPPDDEKARQSYHRSAPDEVQARITLYVVRGVFFLAAAGIGYYTSHVFKYEENTLISILTAWALAVVVMVGEIFFSKAPIRTLSAIAFGLMMGFAISLVFKPVIVYILSSVDIQQEEYDHLLELLQLVTTTIFCYFGVTILIQTKDDFKFIIPYVEFRKDVRGHTPLVLDTSMIIDGRVIALMESRILDQRLVIPRFVLDELQTLADSPNRSTRERGRRGLDILHELQTRYGAEILERDLPSDSEVDRELVELVKELRGKLLTTDFNLQKSARVREIPVININSLASALRPVVVPGETLRVKLIKEGEGPEQGVGFLPDGTMVVVEHASRQIGRDVQVEVTSTTQTNVGKMIFGRLRKPGGARRGRRPGERRSR